MKYSFIPHDICLWHIENKNEAEILEVMKWWQHSGTIKFILQQRMNRIKKKDKIIQNKSIIYLGME